MPSSNCCFLICIQISQEAGKAVWYSPFLKNFPYFVVIHIVKGFGIVNKAEVDVFLELSCFFDDLSDVYSLISGAFSKTSLNIWKFTVHILLKPGMENFEHYFTSVWNECNCVIVWAFFGIHLTNLDSILKSRDITLPTKVHIVKASHVQMWEFNHKENWALKNWCLQTVVLKRALDSPLDCKEIKPVNPKGNQPWMFIGRTDPEAEAPILWQCDVRNWLFEKDSNPGKDWGWEEKGTIEDKMARWHHQFSGHEFEQTLGDSEGQGSLACCSSWGH